MLKSLTLAGLFSTLLMASMASAAPSAIALCGGGCGCGDSCQCGDKCECGTDSLCGGDCKCGDGDKKCDCAEKKQ